MKAIILHTIRYWVIRIIMIIGIIALLILAYFFYNSSVTVFGYQMDNPIYQYSENLEWWLHLIVYFTILSFLSSIVFMILSFYFIKKRDSIENIEKEYKIQFTQKLVQYIYSDFLNESKSSSDYVNELKEVINNKLAQEVFFSLIIRLQLLTSEKQSVKLISLIEKAGLMRSFEYFLYSYNKSEQIIAVRILSYLKFGKHKKVINNYLNSMVGGRQKKNTLSVDRYEKVISKYMNSNNFTLRNESTTALIRMSDANNLDLLLSQRKHISRLGINSIVATVEKTKNKNIDLSRIINSPNPRVAAIGVLLSKSYNKAEYKDLIKADLMRKRVLLHEIAWEAFAYFSETEEDLEFMLESFKGETDSNKLSILNSLKKFTYNKRLGDFLDSVIKNEEIEMKIKALKLLYDVDMSLLLNYKKSSDKKIADSYKEVTDLIIF